MAKRKHTSRCEICTGRKNAPRKMPYGSIGNYSYCHSCDIGNPYKISKKSIRGKVKKEILKLREI